MIGNGFGWRATFVLVAILGTVALAALIFGLPRGLPRATASLAQRIAVARHGTVLQTLGRDNAVGGRCVYGVHLYRHPAAQHRIDPCCHQLCAAGVRHRRRHWQHGGRTAGRPFRTFHNRDACAGATDHRVRAAIGDAEICAARDCRICDAAVAVPVGSGGLGHSMSRRWSRWCGSRRMPR